MSEFSLFWPTGTTGDGATEYTDTQLFAWLRRTFNSDHVDSGPLAGYGGELAVTAGASKVVVATGGAYVYGIPYESDAAEEIALPTPAGSTRIDRVVLRADWATKTVRITRLAGSEGGAAPALTQTPGATYDVPLAQVSITTGGVITVTDEREFCRFATRVGSANLDDGAVTTNKLADNAVATGKIAANAISDARLRDSAALSVIGRATNSTGDPADIAAAADGQVLRRSGTALGFGQVGTAGIANGALSADAAGRAKMAARFVQAGHLDNNIDASQSGFNADTVDGYHAADLIAGGVLTGTIVLWSGELAGSDGHRPKVGGVANESWHLCNGEIVGSVATPDLRDSFVVGAGGSYVRGATGGQLTASHKHGVGTMAAASEGSHKHDINYGAIPALAGEGPKTVSQVTSPTATGSAHTHTLSGDTAPSAPDNRPPYYAVYYIMKVG